DERRRRREKRLGFVDSPLPGAEFALYAAPEELGRDVVGRGELLADPGELGRFVVATLPVQDVGEQARCGRDVVTLAHLLETLVVRSQLRLGGSQIPGEQLYNRRCKRRECRRQEVAELLQRGPAAAVKQARALEVPPHRLQLADRDPRERSRLSVALGPGKHFLARGDGV